MSKDASHTYIHFHHSHHADLFEEFVHPPSATNQHTTANNLATQQPPNGSTSDPTDASLQHIPGHFLPFESINLPSHLMPINPEDEDDVVPDMHAAFGINRAMGQTGMPAPSGERSGRGNLGGRAEEVWRDLGLEELVNGVTRMNVGSTSVSTNQVNGVRREGRRNGILNMR